ncbi:MAG TPA: DUF4177 domain-containing protein [Candidatus Saccharimonadales bacterium]|nr:DUF4177 domain-containing protein [Candidatus Saccharimonadales bacterium]
MNPVKFEYQVAPMVYLTAGPTTQDEQYLNEMGQRGWELVSVIGPIEETHPTEGKRLWLRYYLKRQLG